MSENDAVGGLLIGIGGRLPLSSAVGGGSGLLATGENLWCQAV